jgi:FixJ family two-component response regulator
MIGLPREGLQMNENATVYIVDDDQAVRDGITRLVKDMGLKFDAFSSAEEFLASYNCTGADCLILDVRMTGMSGMELLNKLSAKKMRIPVVLVTGHGDVPMAVEALQKGAVDFLEKPFREQVLWEKIKKALEISNNSNRIDLERDSLMEKVSLLTEKERQVLKHILASKTDKQIAIEMHFTRRTSAHHRASILEKLQAVSLIELAQSFARFDISL